MSQGIIKSWARERVHKQEDSSTERSWHREKQDSSSISSSKSWPGKSIEVETFIDHLIGIRPAPKSTLDFSVVKICNIPHDSTPFDIASYFEPANLISPHKSPYFSNPIHIIMDKFGKALSEAFVEFESFDLATTALRFKSQGLIKGAKVKVVFSNQTELMSALFPTWAKSGRLGSSYSPKITRKAEELPGFYLSREEITGILSFTRAKIISIICKIPWMKKEAVSTTQRDHVFEMVKLSVECILAHHERTNQVIGPNILARLVLTALSCPGFTEKQKVTLMTVSGIKCPTDMEKFVYYPVIDEQDDLETRALKMADIDSVFMPVHDFIKFDQEKMKLGSSKLPIRKLPTFLFPNEAQTPRSNRTATMYPSPPLDSGKLGLKFSYNEAVSGTLEENEKVPASRKESKSKIIAPPVKDINVQELEAIILELKKEKAALQKALSVFVMP